MYQIFVHEKQLSLGIQPINIAKNIEYHGSHTFDMAIDFLKNSPCKHIHIYYEKTEELWRDFTAHFINIGAAGGLVENEKKEYLFIYRLHKWDLPKGKIEKGEEIEATSLREVEEECGIKNLTLLDPLCNTYHIYWDKKEQAVLKTTHWFHMKFEGNETPTPQVEEGITNVEWIGRESIKEKVVGKTFQNILLVLEQGNVL